MQLCACQSKEKSILFYTMVEKYSNYTTPTIPVAKGIDQNKVEFELIPYSFVLSSNAD